MGTKIGVLHVRRSVFIEASVAQVWREFESSERVMKWLNLGHTLHLFEPRVGGRVDMSVEIDGEECHYGGQILVFEADSEVTFEVQWHTPEAWPVPTFWTIRLTPIYSGTLVEIFHHGFERLGDAAPDSLQGYEEAWDIKHLAALRAVVEA
jgi:uncharacterized protein YndB with AHSA1/START domain